MPLKTAAIYSRCSSEESAMKGLSVPDQVEQCQAKAVELGLEVAAVFRDEGISAGVESRDPRDAFDEMIARAKAGEFSHIICRDTSRFGRKPLEGEILEQMLERKHVKVIYLTIPDIGPLTEIVRQVFRTMDRYHSIISREKALSGMRQVVRLGYRAGGPAPYGYRLKHHRIGTKPDGSPYERTTLEPDSSLSGDSQGKNKAEVAEEYFTRRAAGEGRKAIARDFDARGIGTLRGKPWNVSTLSAMEDNLEVYRGVTLWNRSRGGFIPKDEQEHVRMENTHRPLVTAQVAERVRIRRRHKVRPGRKHEYAFSGGILKCGHCGHSFHGNQGIYCCTGRVGRGRDYCPNEGIKANVLEEGVAKILREIYDDEYLEKLAAQRLKAGRSRKKSMKDIIREKIALQAQRERWDEAFGTGKLELEHYLARVKPLGPRLKHLDEELADLQAEGISPENLKRGVRAFLESLHHYPESLRNFVQSMKIHPMKDGKRLFELDLAVRLPKEIQSKLGLSVVAVQEFEKSQVYKLLVWLRRRRARQYVMADGCWKV
jgi:DNA invertase Pin-like site-specific DNA recombinase